MSSDYVPDILAYFDSAGGEPALPRELARALKVRQSQWTPFRAAITQLIDAGQLRLDKFGMITRRRPKPRVQGRIKRSASGAGWLTVSEPVIESEAAPEAETDAAGSQPEARELVAKSGRRSEVPVGRSRDDGDIDQRIYIAPEDMGGALTGDRVEAELLRRRRTGGQRMGRIIAVQERARSTFVGLYFERNGLGFVTIDGGVMDAPIAVGDPGAKGVLPNDKVVVELVKFPTDDEPAEGVITKVLGAHSAIGVDTLSVIHEFQLPDEFPEKVLEAAREVVRIAAQEDDAGRLDLTQETVVTIDPVDARDFDDAISLQKEQNGWRLGVHIADVSHFVTPGSILDREAQRRGTSVYLPDRVLPMLPEQISNGLASLQEGHRRFTKSVFISFDQDGLPTHTEFANSVIQVQQRFAYEQVMPILADPQAAREHVSAKVLHLLQQMHELAMLLRRRRFAHGALDLQLPEVKLDYNEQGQVTGAHQVVHDESHQIIEEFMLAANVAVARKLSELGLHYLHRTHATPDERKLRALGEFVKGLGFEVKPWVGREEIQRLLKAVAATPAAQAISFAVLRSMKQAEYSPAEVGHYALAEDFYCHFTSPIRRYPDLLVHRLFDSLVRKGKHVKSPSLLQLAKLGEHCSETERRAESAERELIKVKLLVFMKGRIGSQFEAIVTGVERFGLFCLGIEIPAEGMVHIKNLPSDQYDYDAKAHTLVGRRSGRMFRLGDRIQVEVKRVDLHQRTLDYRLIESKPRSARVKKSGKNAAKPKVRKRRKE